MTVYDEYGNIITLEISDNEAVLEVLNAQTEKLEQLETVVESQAEIISHLKAENEKITEMNQYCAYIFVIVLFAALYKVLGGALSAMFGGG